jgi:hypothetical protein
MLWSFSIRCPCNINIPYIIEISSKIIHSLRVSYLHQIVIFIVTFLHLLELIMHVEPFQQKSVQLINLLTPLKCLQIPYNPAILLYFWHQILIFLTAVELLNRIRVNFVFEIWVTSDHISTLHFQKNLFSLGQNRVNQNIWRALELYKLDEISFCVESLKAIMIKGFFPV